MYDTRQALNALVFTVKDLIVDDGIPAFAGKSGITEQELRDLLAGKPPPIDILLRICRSVNIPIQSLLSHNDVSQVKDSDTIVYGKRRRKKLRDPFVECQLQLNSVKKTIGWCLSDVADAAIVNLIMTYPPTEDSVTIFLEAFRDECESRQFDLEAKIRELTERVRHYRHLFKEAVTAVEWIPPPNVATAIHAMIFSDPIEASDIVLLLQAMKDEAERQEMGEANLQVSLKLDPQT